MYSSFALNNKHSLLIIHLISWAEPTSSVFIIFFDFLINKNLKNEGWAKFTLIQNCATNVQSESSCSLLFTVYCSKLPNLHNFKKKQVFVKIRGWNLRTKKGKANAFFSLSKNKNNNSLNNSSDINKNKSFQMTLKFDGSKSLNVYQSPEWHWLELIYQHTHAH